MAKLEYELHGEFEEILSELENAVMEGSFTASIEDSSDFNMNDCKCAVRVYERYSAIGGNRVSMNLTLLMADNRIMMSAITAGGSQGMFFKMNTFGEESFLETIQDVVDKYRYHY